jgi:hypothetical protein
MFERIPITARRARSRCAAVHPTTLFSGNRWRSAGLAQARLRAAEPAGKHRASITRMIARHLFSCAEVVSVPALN